MSTIYQRVQFATNLLIIVVALLFIGVFVKGSLGPTPASSHTALPKVGDKLLLPDVDWSKSNKNVLLVLQKGCHFCADSAAFYRNLIEQTNGKNINIVAVLPQNKQEATQYLDELGICGIDVKQSELKSLLVAGTPTIIVANNKGEITNVWLGKLQQKEEEEVLAKIKS